MSRVVISKNKSKKKTKKTTTKTATKSPLEGRVVQFEHDGQKLYGVVGSLLGPESGKVYSVTLAMPDASGVLHKSGSSIHLEQDQFDTDSSAVLSDVERKIKAWAAQLDILKPADGKAAHTPIHRDDDEDKPIVDFLNVKFEGFLSTFVGTTPADRDGDYVAPGAFDKTLADFRLNPVMLTDHTNTVKSLAGSFEKIGVNDTGLAVMGVLSNAPDVISTRFKIVEGHLKTLSMGGLFFFNADGRGIDEVTLWEGSLTPVPANPDARFQVRSLTAEDAVKAMRLFRAA